MQVDNMVIYITLHKENIIDALFVKITGKQKL